MAIRIDINKTYKDGIYRMGESNVYLWIHNNHALFFSKEKNIDIYAQFVLNKDISYMWGICGNEADGLTYFSSYDDFVAEWRLELL